MSILLTLLAIYLLIHLAFSGHRFARSTRHRSFAHRCYLSIPGPFHTRISRRL